MPSQPAVSPARTSSPTPGISTAHRVASPANRLSVRSLTMTYLAALGLIAAWTVCGQLLVQPQIAHRSSDARVIDLAIGQTMLSQRICKDALVLQTQPDSEEREARERELGESVTTLTAVQAGLQHGDAHLSLPRIVDPHLLQVLTSAAPNFTEFLSTAHQIQHALHATNALNASACRRLLSAERGYLTSMESVTMETRSEALSHETALRLTEFFFGVGTLVILGLEALFLFRPMAQNVQTQLGQSKKLDARVTEQATQITAQSAALQTHQEAVASLQASLEAATQQIQDTDTRVAQADSRFHELFHRLPVACYLFDSYGRVVDWNRACEALYLRPANEASQQALWEIITPPHEWDTFREMLTAVLQGTSSEREWDQVRPDGTRVPVLCSAFPVRGANGRISGGVSANIDVSSRRQHEAQIQEHTATLTQQREALEQANARLHTLAMEDGVTGLKNHRAFHEALTREFARVMDSGCREPLSVVMMDVDAFKQYNDNFGHAAGDDVLRRIAQILLRSARGNDLVARYGGEEFAVILSQTDRRGAAAYAERVRASIAAAPWSFQAVTASLGVTTLRVDTPAAAALVAEADAALIRAKAAGRNRVTFADDPIGAETSVSDAGAKAAEAIAA